MIKTYHLKREWRKDMSDYKGEHLREWRMQRELTQEAMADLLGLDSRNSLRSVQEWESGRQRMPYWVRRTIYLMAEVERMMAPDYVPRRLPDGETPWAKNARGFRGTESIRQRVLRRDLGRWSLVPGIRALKRRWGRNSDETKRDAPAAFKAVTAACQRVLEELTPEQATWQDVAHADLFVRRLREMRGEMKARSKPQKADTPELPA